MNKYIDLIKESPERLLEMEQEEKDKKSKMGVFAYRCLYLLKTNTCKNPNNIAAIHKGKKIGGVKVTPNRTHSLWIAYKTGQIESFTSKKAIQTRKGLNFTMLQGKNPKIVYKAVSAMESFWEAHDRGEAKEWLEKNVKCVPSNMEYVLNQLWRKDILHVLTAEQIKDFVSFWNSIGGIDKTSVQSYTNFRRRWVDRVISDRLICQVISFMEINKIQYEKYRG